MLKVDLIMVWLSFSKVRWCNRRQIKKNETKSNGSVEIIFPE